MSENLPNDQQQGTAPQAPETQPQQTQPVAPEAPQVDPRLVESFGGAAPAAPQVDQDENFAAFNKQLQQYLGVDVNALRQTLGYIQQSRREAEVQQLRSQWGENYDSNFEAVQSRLREIYAQNPAQAAALNNAQGAMLVWNTIQAERQQQQARQAVPGFDVSRTQAAPTGNGNYLFTRSQIEAMSPQEKRAAWPQIQAAYANGLVNTQA